MPTVSITVLFALILAGVIALTLVRVRERVHFWGRLTSWVPSLVMILAFLMDVSGRRLFTFGAAVLSVAFYLLTLLGIRLVARDPGALSLGGLYGVVTIVGLLYTFGSLLQVRLHYQRDPSVGPLVGADLNSAGEFLVSQGTPLVVLAGAVGSVWAWPYLSGWRNRAPRQLHTFLTAQPRAAQVVVVALVITAFYLPLLGPATNSAHLTFLGIHVSEWVRPFWILTIAYLLARNRHCVNWRMIIRGDCGAFTWSLIALVVGVAFAGNLRSDYGTVLPLVFATPAMILTLSHQDRDSWLSKAGSPDSMAASPLTSQRARLLSVVALALVSVSVLLLVNFTIPGTKGRLDAWQDPWQFAWTPECTPAADPPDWITPGTGYTNPVPAGYELCIESMRDAYSSNRSQTARALTVIDGGGLWGRGLSDTEAGIVPVLNSDFVLAAIWSKLGGLTVYFSTLLVIVLWYLLTRHTSRSRWEGLPGSQSDRAYIYAAGLGAMIAWQAVYVMLSTTNIVLLSGVPFPFLARGGQAMGGLMFGIVVLIWLTQRSNSPSEDGFAARQAGSDVPVSLVRHAILAVLRSIWLWLAVVVSTVAIAVGTLFPFASWKAGDLNAGLEHPGVQAQLRARGLAPLLRVDGEDAFALDRASGSWFALAEEKPPLELHDLFGVVRTDDGGAMGLLEGTAGALLQSTIERTVQDRLRETPTPRRVLDITIDPTLQTVVANAVREPVDAGYRLPSGVVVVEATSGAIRALSTAPDELNPLLGRASEAEIKAWYDKELGNSAWGKLLEDAIGRPGETDCNSKNVKCGRYRLRPVPDPMKNEDYLRTYVGGDSAYDLPDPYHNRAVGRRYNLGSTFKIVIAAAYIEAGGKITDRIASPDYVVVGGQHIGPRCRGTRDGTITLAQALKFSCNPAFIQLARDLGWDSIASVAERLGFTPVELADALKDNSLWPASAHIPATVDSQSIGTNAIGGDTVASTPFKMAAMMAAIANGGMYLDPYLVSEVGDNESSTPHEVEGVMALSPHSAAQLKAALTEVTGEGGTLDDVEYDESKVHFYGKTGTHVARQESASGQYTARFFWIVGAAERVEKRDEPIAFAVVVEGRDPQLGRMQVRTVAAKILNSFAESER